LNDVQYAGRNPLIVVSTVSDPVELAAGAAEPPDVATDSACGGTGALAAVHQRGRTTSSSGSASTDTSDVRLDVSPRATSSRCDDDNDDDDVYDNKNDGIDDNDNTGCNDHARQQPRRL